MMSMLVIQTFMKMMRIIMDEVVIFRRHGVCLMRIIMD